MRELPQHLVSKITAEDVDALLTEWRWLIGEDKHALFLTASGDVFLSSKSGAVFWLETGGGVLTQVAQTLSEFELALLDPERRREWLLEPVVESLQSSGKNLLSDQCYGYSVLPALGGDYQGDNRFVVSAREHLGLTGELHNQIKDLPDGSQVQIKWTD